MTTSHGLGNAFSYMPSEYFLIERWDVASSLDQDEQERNLIDALGRNGRRIYRERCVEMLNIPFPDHIPPTFSSFEKRRTTDVDDWGTKGAIWIRTWYGNEGRTGEEETVTCANANEAYLRLWRKALFPEDKNEFDEDMFGPLIFDNSNAGYQVLAHDADDGVELINEIPFFILNALVQCPDVMEASQHWERIEGDDALASQQALLVVIADGEACEDGWVLLVALNHKGQVLYPRARCKAWVVNERVYFWRNEGEPLDESGSQENVLYYMDANQSGDGWDMGEPL